MDDELPSAGTPEGPRTKWSHDWYSYEGYLNVYTSHMDDLLNEGVVLHNGLSFREITDGQGELLQVQVHGTVSCDRSVVVVVEKWLDVRRDRRGHREVKGRSYSYGAYSEKSGQPILRYDCHGWGGVEQLHKHVFDPRSGRETRNEPIALDALPPLDGVIREAVAAAP